MKSVTWVALAVLSALIVGQLAVPFHTNGAVGGVSPAAPALPSPAAAPASHVTAAVHPLAATNYARTVLVETFTAEWCVYCEQESQALYAIQQQTNQNLVVVGELHICYSSSYCGDNYPTADNTSNERGSFYSVYAFPTVWFDGGGVEVGASTSGLAALETEYSDQIANASAVPGTVAISQAATISAPGTVTDHATVTSAVNGTFHAMTYLVQYLGFNDSTHHDLGWIVRAALVNQQLTVTAGNTYQLTGTKVLGAGWDQLHLGVVTFLQQNSTKVVQNTNFAPVTNEITAVSATPGTVSTGYPTTVSVSVTNSTTGAALSGATVNLTSSAGGVFSVLGGTTDSNGAFSSTFTAPKVSDLTNDVITATISDAGYTTAKATTVVVVNPLDPPTAPLSLLVMPQPVATTVVVGWSAPSSGGGGVTYHIYRSTSATSGFAEIATSTTTSYSDTSVVAGTSYWYEVNAQNPAGFSTNGTAISALSVGASSQGLPATVGWWITIAGVTFDSSTNAALSFHLSQGDYPYTFGADSYAYDVASGNPAGTAAIFGATPSPITLAFGPRYADLEGSVTPGNATVMVNGQSVAVSGGSFSDLLVAGTYTVAVSANGFTSNSSTVVLTPGNVSTVSFQLSPINAAPTSNPTTASTSSQGFSTLQVGLIAGVIGLAAILGLILAFGRRGPPRPPARRPPARRPPTQSAEPSDPSEP